MSERIKPIIFYLVFFLFLLAFSATATTYDYDLWARLIAGMGFVQSGHVLKHDFLSYTPTHTWFDHEWGSGVIFYLTRHFFSSAGILLLQAGLIFLIFFIITKIVALREVRTTTAYNFLFYYFAFISMSSLLIVPIRCQMFSFLFFTVFLYILELSRRKEPAGTNLLYALPFLMIIWNNLHGGCVSGIGLIVIYLVGEFLNKKPIKKYIYVLGPTILALLINPWGFEYIKFLLKATTMPRIDVIEWWGLFSKYMVFQYMKFKIFALVLILAQIGVAIKQIKSRKFELDWTKFLVLGVTLFLAIQHIKLIPFAVISMTCFLYDDFYSAFNWLTKNAYSKFAKVKESMVYGLILIFVISNINKKAFEPLPTMSKYPVLPIEFLKTNEIKGNLLISFGYGSYASYKLYPNNKIFIDGRYEEVYYDYMMPLLRTFYLGNPGWDDLLRKYPPDIMIIEKFYAVCNLLRKDKNWKAVYSDKFYVVFVKTKDARKTYKNPTLNPEYYKKTTFDTDIKFGS